MFKGVQMSCSLRDCFKDKSKNEWLSDDSVKANAISLKTSEIMIYYGLA